METQSSAYSFILQSLPVEERAALLDLGARLGLTVDAPEWAMIALGRFILVDFKTIPGQVEQAGKVAATALRTERAGLEQSVLRFVALADALPAQVETAVRAGVPAIGAAFADAVEDSVVAKVAERVGALEAERAKQITQVLADARAAVASANAEIAKLADASQKEIQSVRAAGARAAVMSGFWYPATALVAVLVALVVGWTAYFAPIQAGPVFTAGRTYESKVDREFAIKAPKQWAQFLKQGK